VPTFTQKAVAGSHPRHQPLKARGVKAVATITDPTEERAEDTQILMLLDAQSQYPVPPCLGLVVCWPLLPQKDGIVTDPQPTTP
jgi:hypothetical protein